MTSLRARPLLFLLSCCFVAALFVGSTPMRASAGHDDFEFGQALAAMGAKTGDKAYFAYARRVFNGVIGDENRSEADKDLCRYGLAEMKRNEAIGATGNMDMPYKAVLALFEEGISTMESFVKKNPDHERATEAQLQVGTTRLAFVQWARDNLLTDPDYAIRREADASQVQSDAESMVRGAIRYFDGLQQGYEEVDAPPEKQVARYYWVLCQYYLALVYESGSDEQARALESAAKHLDDFISLNDGQLLAVYAQDIFGLTRWEQAKTAETEEEREKFYRRAVDWFGTCTESEVYSPQWEGVIANGYLHIGQCCREAGRVGKTNFVKMGINYLSQMEDRFPTVARKQNNCIRAMIEWAHLEFSQDHSAEAVEIAQKAGEWAKGVGSGWLENQANRALREFISGRRSGHTSADPDVLMRVADNFFNEKKWTESIGAYQQVITAVERTEKNADLFIIRSWERISASYRALGDLMACAQSLEPVHAIWADGLVKKVGGPDDPNMIRLGNIRKRAERAWKELHDVTGSQVYRKRFTGIRDSFSGDYPEHPSSMASEWNAASEKFSEAVSQMKARDNRWRATLKQTIPLYTKVSKDMKSDKLDDAVVKLIYIQYLLQDWPAMLREGEKASAFWASKRAQDQAKKFATTIGRSRKIQVGRAKVWRAEALYRQEKWDDVIKTLEGWRAEHGETANTTGRVDFTSRALGHLVNAWIGKGDIDEANVYYRRLLKDNPGYSRLSKISFALAEHFNKYARVIDKERSVARGLLKGTKTPPTVGARTQFKTTNRDLGRAESRLGDLSAGRAKHQRAIDLLEELKKKGLQIPAELPGQVKEAKKKIPEYDAQIKAITEKVNRLGAEKDKLEKQVTELTDKIKALAQQLYEPLVQAASYYWDWDQALITANQTREAKNIAIFADLYFKAGLLRPEAPDNWTRSQSLYEDYLKMPDADEETKQEALGRLGTIYSRLAARAEPGSEQRAQLIKKALGRLQGSLARLPENNDLVVGLLTGDVVVIPWRQKGSQTLHRFPLPRVKDVEELKRAVQAMGTASGPKMPRFRTEVNNKRFDKAIGFFKIHVGEVMTEEQVKRTVKGFAKAGFDMGFYREHAEASAKFRAALAWIYSESGEFEHMNKALNLASSLVIGRHAAEEDSPAWWEAQVIRLSALVTGAELQAKASPAAAPSPIVKEWTERASKMLLGLHTSSPELGDESRPETRKELKVLLERVQQLRNRSGLKPLNLILDKLEDK